MENTLSEATAPQTEFDSLLTSLQREVEAASELAYGLEKTSATLKPFNEGQGCDKGKEVEPQGYLNKLGSLIGRMTEINTQNGRSLNHLQQML